MNKTINTKQELISNFEEHLKIPFPRVSGNDELQDIKGELSLYGSHVAGLVSSYLQNAEINVQLVEKDNELENRMTAFEPHNAEDHESLQNMQSYKHKIDKLVTLLNELVK